MSFWTKLAGFFGGSASKAVEGAATGVADIVERWNPGIQKKHEMLQDIRNYLGQTVADARAHDSPLNSGVPIVDAVVNGINRLIRPWVTITVVGSLFGYWDLPAPEAIDPRYFEMSMIILGFWFGGRFIVKDIPMAIRQIMK